MLAPMLGCGQTYDISDEQARTDLSPRRGHGPLVRRPVRARAGPADRPQAEVDEGQTLAERFLIRWKGEADPKHVKAIDAYWSRRPSTA